MATYETDSMIILILQVRKEGIEKLNVFFQNHTASMWQDWDFKSGPL